jgi:hypothetical protein
MVRREMFAHSQHFWFFGNVFELNVSGYGTKEKTHDR